MKKKYVLSIVLLISALGIVGCGSDNKRTVTSTSELKTTVSTKESSATSTSEEKNIGVTIALNKDDEQVTEKTFDVKEGCSLMDALKQEFDVKEENGFITSIDGIEQNKEESYYWTFTVNGDMGKKGAADTELKEGDRVIFTYAKYE